MDSFGKVVALVMEEVFFTDMPLNIFAFLNLQMPMDIQIYFPREKYFRNEIDHLDWLDKYNNILFFRLFRVQKVTFEKLLNLIMINDNESIIKKKYTGGNKPVPPEKGLLVFLWFMSKQDPLNSIADRFGIVPSTVMKIINAFLYIVVGLKHKLIHWPRTNEEYEYIKNGFKNYPGTIGAVDGSHVFIKVPETQQDSYIDRYHRHSINLMAICTYEKILTYVFVGFPGSAHDSRNLNIVDMLLLVSFVCRWQLDWQNPKVFSNSTIVKHIDRFGPRKYFPNDDLHIIGDSAFPLRTWLITPYPRNQNMSRIQKHHNFKLSSDRVVTENTFAFVKIRWGRLQFINTYSVSKAIEITTAACVLHNFCYKNNDIWEEQLPHRTNIPEGDNLIRADQSAIRKRNNIAQSLWRNAHAAIN